MAKVAKEEHVVLPLVRLTKVGDGVYRYGDGSEYPDARKFEDAEVIPVVFVEKKADGTYEYVEASDVEVSWGDITGKPSTFPPASHTHEIEDVNGLQSALDGKAAASHTHDDRYYTESEVDAALAGKADATHTHEISDVNGLQSALDGKAAASHTHSISQVSNLQSALDAKLTAAQAEAQADSEAADLETLVADFNALLAKLRAAGIMAE